MTTFNFNSFAEAAQFAQANNSAVHFYSQRAGEQSWTDEGAIYAAIEAHTDDSDYRWFERTEGALDILSDMDSYNSWLKDFSVKIKAAVEALDLEKAQELIDFANSIKDEVEALEEGEEAVAVMADEYETINRFPTMGEYDGRSWQIGVPTTEVDF